MKRLLISSIVLVASVPCVAFAQTGSAGSSSGMQTNTSSMHADTSNQQSAAGRLATVNKVKQDLQNAGFQDVQVVAEAFVVRAKTKDGDPVVMTLGPHGLTAFEAVNATGSTQAMSGKGAMNKQSVTVSRLTGMNLYDGAGNKLGDVERVVSNDRGSDSVVIGHGGFLGMGEKQVAVSLDNVVMRNDRLITHDLTNDQIKAMPEWKRGQQADVDGSRTVQVQKEG